MTSSTNFAARLESVIGVSHVSAGAAICAEYAVDERTPFAVARPSCAEEAAEIVRFAGTDKLAIIACGARTKLRMGMTPARYDIAVDMTGLNQIAHYDPGDLTLSVDAGMPLAKVNATLSGHKQFLPLLVPYYSASTIGGTLASGVDSPLRQFYGTARDFLIGAEFVDGKGNQCKSGGRVVKNVTGYDLHKLLIGSLGTLGVITRLNFRTFPAPESSRGFVASFTDAEGALALRRAIAESPLTPLTLDVVSPGLARIFAERTPSAPEVLVFAGEVGASDSTTLPPIGGWFRAKEWQLCAAFAGTPEVLQRYERDLTRFAEDSNATSPAVLDDSTRPSVWGRLRETLAMLRDTSPATAIFKVTLLPLQHAKAFVELQEIADRAAVTPAFVARANGILYFALVPGAPSGTALEKFVLAMHETFSLAQRLNGYATLLFGPLALKKHAGIWSGHPPGLALMRRVKSAFDPHNIFGPGRLGGDI